MSPLAANRDFTRLWVGEAVSVFGTRIASVAFPLVVLAMGGTAADAGLAAFFRTLPYFLLSLPVGVLVDRVDRRRLMLVSSPRSGQASRGSDGSRFSVRASSSSPLRTWRRTRFR